VKQGTNGYMTMRALQSCTVRSWGDSLTFHSVKYPR
jgi:hypothetical protein